MYSFFPWYTYVLPFLEVVLILLAIFTLLMVIKALQIYIRKNS